MEVHSLVDVHALVLLMHVISHVPPLPSGIFDPVSVGRTHLFDVVPSEHTTVEQQ
jgi:hypothetical protein